MSKRSPAKNWANWPRARDLPRLAFAWSGPSASSKQSRAPVTISAWELDRCSGLWKVSWLPRWRAVFRNSRSIGRDGAGDAHVELTCANGFCGVLPRAVYDFLLRACDSGVVGPGHQVTYCERWG